MAVKDSNRATNVGSSQRFAIGANVLLSVVLAVGLLIAVNLIASIKSYRSDLASVGNYGLSDRTKNVLGSLQKDVKLSLLYEPDEGDKAQQERITRMPRQWQQRTILVVGASLTRRSPFHATTKPKHIT